MNKVSIVACSNGQEAESKSQNDELISILKSVFDEVLISDCLYARRNVFQSSPEKRAAELMRMFCNPEITEIYDISGGDIANQVLPFLDYDLIKTSNATFWGYSDLTTVINAIYAATGKESVLYQVKNMVWGDFNKLQQERFRNRENLFDPQFTFVQGNRMEGIVVGGNIRCFLKLAGTKYFPNLDGKLLFLEALSGKPAQMATFLAQLQQLDVFEKVNGILLGNFREMEKEQYDPDIIELVKSYAGPDLPIAKTSEIGHKSDSKAIVIGRNFVLEN